ncbi:hypothetical protein EMGR_006625 [Emarellia grisea]
MSFTINLFGEVVIYLWPEQPAEAYDHQGCCPDDRKTEKQRSEGNHSKTTRASMTETGIATNDVVQDASHRCSARPQEHESRVMKTYLCVLCGIDT